MADDDEDFQDIGSRHGSDWGERLGRTIGELGGRAAEFSPVMMMYRASVQAQKEREAREAAERFERVKRAVAALNRQREAEAAAAHAHAQEQADEALEDRWAASMQYVDGPLEPEIGGEPVDPTKSGYRRGSGE